MIVGRMKALLAVAAMFLATPLWAQQTLPDAPMPQNIPDASKIRNADAGPPPPPSTSQAPTGPQTQPQTQQPAPRPEVKTVPHGGETQNPGPSQRDELYKYVTNVNFVMVPVTVKDNQGRPVYGLTKDNFKILENGVKQPISYFTSDPFAISAAIVVDVSMPEISLKKFQDTVQALISSFSEYDEVAVYTYGETVKQQQDFNAALGERTATTFRKVKVLQGTPGGASTTQGPMVLGPTVNGQVFNPGDPSVHTTTSVRNIDPSRVLNDAILRAAMDLSKRPRDRRKVIFVISDGREDRSVASYQDVLKVLLSNNVQVYALGLDTAALPLYGKLSKVRLPRQPYGNILPKYANATGGEVINTLSKEAMEDAYARLMGEARNQYTVGYTSPATLSTAYRGIEVRVSTDAPVKVYARDGYYPLPPARK